jgi:hypothetical protein
MCSVKGDSEPRGGPRYCRLTGAKQAQAKYEQTSKQSLLAIQQLNSSLVGHVPVRSSDS